MKFICTQENLLRGLSVVTPVAGRGSQLPILKNILLTVKNSALQLTATDLEIGIKVVVGGKQESTGMCAVAARQLLEYVQQLPPSDPVVLELYKKALRITSSGFRAEFPIADTEEFPLLPEGKDGTQAVIGGNTLSDALLATMFSASREEARPEIRSVYVHGDSENLYFAATDSYRLAEYVVQYKKNPINLLIPLSSAQEIARVFVKDEDVVVTVFENHATFSSDTVELFTRLTNGVYPDYRQIIPKKHSSLMSVDCDEFIRALKTVGVFLPHNSRRVYIVVQPSKGNMLVSVTESTQGQADVSIDIEGKGEDVDVLVNIQYILEGAQHISSKKCDIALISPHDPVVLRPHTKSVQYSYVVMPIQAS